MRDLVQQGLLGFSFVPQDVGQFVQRLGRVHLRLAHAVTREAVHLEPVRTSLIVGQVCLHQIPFARARRGRHVVLVALIHDVFFPLAVGNGAHELAPAASRHEAQAAELQLRVVVEALAVWPEHGVVADGRQTRSPHAVAEVHGCARARLHDGTCPTGQLVPHAILAHAHESRGVGRVDGAGFG